MEKKIKVMYGNKTEEACEILSKLEAEQKILALFETQEIEKIEITYKKREPACTADPKISANNIIGGEKAK